jgi:hypothetical protein
VPHFRVDDGFHSHPKVRKAGLEAVGMWAVCGPYCTHYGTDGFVPEWFVKTWPKGTALAKRLVDANLWNPAERDGENGWQFHQFTGPGRNDTAAEVEESRRKWRERKAGQRGASPPMSHWDIPEDTQGDTARDTPVDSSRATRDPTQPNPTEKNSGCEPSNPDLGRPPNGARGKRLPDGWEPSADVIAQMRSDHPHVDLKAEHLKFVDYWHDQPGAKGRKVDWNGTWRNWIRRAAEQRTPHAVNGHTMATSDLRVAQVQALKSVPSQRLELE